MMQQRRSTPPPPGSYRCSVCKNFAWNDVGQHAVKSGGAWHHPSCPQLGLRVPSFEKTRRRKPSAIERMLILFRGHVDLSGFAFYFLGLCGVVVIVQTFFVACG
jgi:hypothetical protein